MPPDLLKKFNIDYLIFNCHVKSDIVFPKYSLTNDFFVIIEDFLKINR